MKRFFLVFLVFFLLCPAVKAEEEEKYLLADASAGSYRTIEEYETYREAAYAFGEQQEEYDNLVILQGDKVLKMEYGIVEFLVNEGCSLNQAYTNEHGEESYTNGCYAIDALYLDTSRDGSVVYFALSGDRGEITQEQVLLHPLETLDVRISMYTVQNGALYHEVKSQLKTDFYYAMILLGDAPSFLKEGKDYYSYDGHYFYEDLLLMSDDYRAEIHENAVNPEEPYYNYFQYLPHRSLSAYSGEEVDAYFRDSLMYTKRPTNFLDLGEDHVADSLNASQLSGNVDAFFAYQYLYGSNAMMMLSQAVNESASGKSYASYNRNNLFSHAAYDSDEERNASRYRSVRRSVYAHAKYYISHTYSSIYNSNFMGSFFGNKASGMNVYYSTDPYWGEKAASRYYRLDQSLGGKDKDRYAIGIIEEDSQISFYRDASLRSRRFRLNNIYPYAVILLGEEEGVSKVQIEPSFRENYYFDFAEDTAYVSSSLITQVLNPDKIGEQEYITVTFDAGEGVFDEEQNTVTMKVPKGQTPSCPVPEREGYVFTGYDKEMQPAKTETVYTAEYKKVNDFTVNGFPKRTVRNDALRFPGATLTVTYEDGTQEDISLTSDQVGFLDTSVPGSQDITIRYAGITKTLSIIVSQELEKENSDIREKSEILRHAYRLNSTYYLDELKYVREKLQEVGDAYLLDMDEIHDLDQMFLDEYREGVDFLIEDELGADASVSGMALALNVSEEDYSDFFLKNVYRFVVKAAPEETAAVSDAIAANYGYDKVLDFAVEFKRNRKVVEASLPFVVQLQVPDMELTKVYSVYSLDDNGEIVSLPCRRSSNYVRFLAVNEGPYMVMSRNTDDNYALEDVPETINSLNMDRDNQRIFFLSASYGILVLYNALMIGEFQRERKKKKQIRYGCRDSVC